jgi:hypothetical protein
LLSELGLGESQLVLAPLQVCPLSLELLRLRRIRELVPHGGEPPALRPERPQTPSEAPLAQRELPLGPLELPFPDRDRSSPFPERTLQIFEVRIPSPIVPFPLKNPLRHRASNVHPLCGIEHPEYDHRSWGEVG